MTRQWCVQGCRLRLVLELDWDDFPRGPTALWGFSRRMGHLSLGFGPGYFFFGWLQIDG